MSNLYTDSVLSNASLSFSFNDFSRNSSSSFNGGYPSSSCCRCSCNCCSSIPIKTVSSSRLVPINPSPYYGFRQSALIQRAPSRRRRIIASGASIGDLNPTRNYYRTSSCIRDLGFDWIRCQGMKGKGIGFGGYGTRMSALEDRYILHKVEAACDDAEAILSLLTEELSDENISVDQRRKKVSLSSKGNARENVVGKRRLKNVEARGRKEGYRMKGDDSRLRKGGTSGSSYYSCSDLGDSEVIVAKHEECTGKGSEQESRKRVGLVEIKKQAKQETKGRRIDLNGRKYHTNQSRQSESHVSSSHEDSSLKMQYNSRVGESVTKVHSSDMQSSRYRLKDNRASGTADSSNKYEHLTGSSGFVDEKSTIYLSKASGGEEYVISAGETSDSSYNMTDSSGSLSKVSGSKEHVVSAGGFCRTCGQVTSGSEAGTVYEQRSKLYAETKVASRQESSSLIQKRGNEVREQHKQEHLVASNQFNLRKSEDYTERQDAAESYENISMRRSKLSETQNTDMMLTSIVGQQSETRIKRQEEKTTSIQTSLKEVNEKIHQQHLVATTETELTRKNQECVETKVASRQESSSLIQKTANEVHEQHKKEHLVASNQINLSEDYTERADAAESYEDNTNIFRRRSKLSETQNTDMRLTSIVGQQSEIKIKRQEEKSTSSQTSFKEVNEESHQEQLVASSQTDLMRGNHKHIELVDKQEACLKVSEENVVSLSSQLAKGELFQIGKQVMSQKQPRKSSKAQTGSSKKHLDGSVIAESSSASEERLHYEQSCLTERVKETHEHVKETIKQTEIRYEVQTPLREPSFVKERGRHPFVTSTPQVRIEEIGEDQDKRDSPSDPSPMLGPHSQLIEVTHEHATETVKQTEFGYEVQTPLREPGFVKDSGRHPIVTSTSQVRIEEIDKDKDKEDLPSGPSPWLDLHPQFIEVTHEHAKETLKQTELRYEVQTPLREPGFNEETSRHPCVTTTSQVRIEEIGEQEDERNFPSVQSLKLNPPSQSVEVYPVFVEPGSSFPSQDSCRHSGGESSMASAELMESSCHQTVGDDSVEKIIHEKSTTVNEVGNKLPERQILSDENLPLEQPHKREQSESAAMSHSGIVKRSGRALWNVLTYGVLTTGGNVSRETNNVLNVDKMSSQATVSTNQLQSDTIDELHESGKEATKSGTLEQTNDVSDLTLTFVSSSEENAAELRQGTLQRSNLVMKERLDEWDGAYRLESEQRKIDRRFRRRTGKFPSQDSATSWEIPLPRLDGHPVYVDSTVTFPSQDSGGEPSIYIDPQSTDASQHVDLMGSAELVDISCHQVVDDSVEEIRHEESTSVIEVENKLPERQLLSDEKLTQSGIVKRSGRALWNVLSYGVLNTAENVSGETNNDLNVDKSGKEATISGTMDQIKDDSDFNVTVVSSSEEKAAELRRGMLQRSNQVMKERFDEWDKAYRLESEQRKIDQTFMREALEEAKKAADMWEVPVGAVLVQDGKIIARGHNLVEDSRDSTAHAEIVCIRAASSILKTWRLSETTLYVTLEPCAMCAGAILQARIGTLVYGAPNKLLGADGSWVRLFPRSVNGEGDSESASKTEGPIHPFHPKMKIRRGILEAECGELMQQSFKLRRNKDKKTEQRDEQRSNKKLHNPSKLLHKMHHKFHILFHL